METEEIALRFVAAINGADMDSLSSLMTEDHVFLDSDGSSITGRESMRRAWTQYFSIMPGYRIEVEEIYHLGNRVVLIGSAKGGSVKGGSAKGGCSWSVPAAWRAVVEGGRVAVWQVFVNPEPVRAALLAPAGGSA